ncbi:MAG: hypothetical protein AEth_00599 [Candidatus Argoarchaeum ethanivorans]|uniref:Calcineurin-like phosphoesterase domain-containing protein n=1 Tax=Candidatus Argoarchaeum ethanivorans TaxID=2608793 RepID=A0A8B3S3N2_9EURY|nr:MAG: hypothetical protein AEth_00599 [Candidatus Argoarchaeum ethanivorans]
MKVKIVHLSDIHTANPHFLPEMALEVVERINEINPEIVIITGDLTESGYPFEFKCAKSYIEKINCASKVIIPGNHDVRHVGDLCFEEIFGSRSKVRRYKGITIVGIDSTQPDIDDGHIGRDKYEWIEKCFDTDDFKIFALHHHLMPVPFTGRERNIPVDAGDVLELLVRCKVDLVLSGHKHVPWVWNLDGMTILNAGTACTNRMKWSIPQSFNLIELDSEMLRIYKIYSKGGHELILEKPHNFVVRG